MKISLGLIILSSCHIFKNITINSYCYVTNQPSEMLSWEIVGPLQKFSDTCRAYVNGNYRTCKYLWKTWKKPEKQVGQVVSYNRPWNRPRLIHYLWKFVELKNILYVLYYEDKFMAQQGSWERVIIFLLIMTKTNFCVLNLQSKLTSVACLSFIIINYVQTAKYLFTGVFWDISHLNGSRAIFR